MARSHMGICLNLGITPAQLHQLLDIVSRNIGPGEADAVRKELNTLLQAKGCLLSAEPDKMRENRWLFISPQRAIPKRWRNKLRN